MAIGFSTGFVPLFNIRNRLLEGVTQSEGLG